MHPSDAADSNDDPLFQLSMIGMAAEALGLVSLVWEFQDGLLYFAGAHAALGLVAPCMTPAAFQSQLHPADQLLFDEMMLDCQSTQGAIAQQRLRLSSGSQGWKTIDCRLKVSERDEDGTPARILGMLLPVV